MKARTRKRLLAARQAKQVWRRMIFTIGGLEFAAYVGPARPFRLLDRCCTVNIDGEMLCDDAVADAVPFPPAYGRFTPGAL